MPAHNEAELIPRCLLALGQAAVRSALWLEDLTIIVLANNCSDGTAAVARHTMIKHADVVVHEIRLPPHLAHAGGARRYALDAAAAYLPYDGILMTTDADSEVDGEWMVANLSEFAGGADAVAGSIDFRPAERDTLPVLPNRDLEWTLAARHAELESLIDPCDHDPWPRHIWAWGASLTLTKAAYRAIGGLPVVALAEDRALAAALERADLKLRRSLAPRVFTSARPNGRAPGGFADLIQTFADNPAALCDAALEPTALLVDRLLLRAACRRHFRCAATGKSAGFGPAWHALEISTPALVRQRVRPADLAREVQLAEDLIAVARH